MRNHRYWFCFFHFGERMDQRHPWSPSSTIECRFRKNIVRKKNGERIFCFEKLFRFFSQHIKILFFLFSTLCFELCFYTISCPLPLCCFSSILLVMKEIFSPSSCVDSRTHSHKTGWRVIPVLTVKNRFILRIAIVKRKDNDGKRLKKHKFLDVGIDSKWNLKTRNFPGRKGSEDALFSIQNLHENLSRFMMSGHWSLKRIEEQ